MIKPTDHAILTALKNINSQLSIEEKWRMVQAENPYWIKVSLTFYVACFVLSVYLEFVFLQCDDQKLNALCDTATRKTYNSNSQDRQSVDGIGSIASTSMSTLLGEVRRKNDAESDASTHSRSSSYSDSEDDDDDNEDDANKNDSTKNTSDDEDDTISGGRRSGISASRKKFRMYLLFHDVMQLCKIGVTTMTKGNLLKRYRKNMATVPYLKLYKVGEGK